MINKLFKKILIVEDEPSLLKALEIKFIDEGFEVIKAVDGKQGLEMSLLEHPDIILLDIVMPIMDGMTMLKKLREDKWGKDAKVIILTNLSDAEKVAKAAEHNVFDFLVKTDWHISDVVEKVKERLGK
ncbi:response regulator [Patescibacteria group bacterium]|nr:response regulator [Patescibacteria group bacterium]